MRCALCVVIVLVSLALIALMFGRVTTSSAYIVRARFGEIREGMTRNEVSALMAGIPREIEHSSHSGLDLWLFCENYSITVEYDRDERGQEIVVDKHFEQVYALSPLDRLLEVFGFPKSTVFRF
jgi:hypothetical protein